MRSASPRTKTLLADLGLLYASAIWGSTFILVKASLDAINPVTMVGYRFLLAAVLLGLYLRAQKKALFSNFGPGLAVGLALTLLYVPQTIGLGITSAANSAFITGLFVAFVPFLSLVILNKKPRPAQWAATAISLAGLWLLTGGMADANTGDLITLVSAFCYALHIMLGDRFVNGHGDVMVLSFQQFLVVGVASLLAALVFNQPLEISAIGAAGVVVFLAVFPTLLAFVIQFQAQKRTSPVKVALIFALEPVFAGVFAWTLGGEAFIPLRALGGLLIFAAIVVSTVRLPAKQTSD